MATSWITDEASERQVTVSVFAGGTSRGRTAQIDCLARDFTLVDWRVVFDDLGNRSTVGDLVFLCQTVIFLDRTMDGGKVRSVLVNGEFPTDTGT